MKTNTARIALLPLAALLTSCVHLPGYARLVERAPTPHERTLIKDVRLFRGNATTAEEHMDVLLDGERIAAVAPTGTLSAPRTIDGAGQTLLPGFIDLHAHLTYTAAPPWYLTLPKPQHNAEAHVYAGVTTVLDLGGDVDAIVALRRRIANDQAVGPRIFFAGPHLTVPRGYPLNMIRAVYGQLATLSLEGSHAVAVKSAAELEQRIDVLHQKGATFIKLMVATVPPSGAPRLDEETIRRAVVRAHGHGMKVAAHIDSTEDALICARAGVDLLAHGVETAVVTAADAATLARSGIAVEPTLVSWSRWDELSAGHYRGSQLERETEPQALLASLSDRALKDNMHLWSRGSFGSWGEALHQHRGDRPTNLVAMVHAGVRLVVGSDAMGSVATFAGAYHDELRLLVEAGLPVGEVLRAATGDAAKLLAAQPDFGTIEPGKAADLVLVRGNPLDDVRATTAIEKVFVRGAEIKRTPVR